MVAPKWILQIRQASVRYYALHHKTNHHFSKKSLISKRILKERGCQKFTLMKNNRS